MKRSTSIILSSAITLAIASCKNKEQEQGWIVGDNNGQVRDTTTENGRFRYFGGLWYPLMAGRINPGIYQGASSHQVATPGYKPVRTGGFGRSGYTAGS